MFKATDGKCCVGAVGRSIEIAETTPPPLRGLRTLTRGGQGCGGLFRRNRGYAARHLISPGYLPIGKGQRKQLQSLSFFLDKHCICAHRCYFIWRYVCYRKRDIFSLTLNCYITSRFALQMCGRLRYDINPFTPERAYRIEDISHAARVYRKSRKGFISLHSVLKGTTHTARGFFLFKSCSVDYYSMR